MDNFQIFVILMFLAVLLTGVSQKIHIPYPIALVLGGVVIGFIPHERLIPFDPELILEIVLPPILYYAAFGISYREFKSNFRPILSLSLGLVFLTTIVIGVIFKWLFPTLPWALAFAFGAIVSPPDAIAATTILKRFAISNRLLTILEGESLVNDASALVLYKIAVIALLSGRFSFSEGSMDFITTVSGGIILGFVIGYILQYFSRRYLEPVVGVLFSFTIPYLTYILAETLGVSGVLAVVVNGLVGSQFLIRHYSSLRRILGFAVWDIFIILMNCFVFILIGLQLYILTLAMTMKQMVQYAGYAFLITVVMLAVRMIWVYSRSGILYFRALHNPKRISHCPQILREAALVGWSGMRGIVSLTAALALPLVLPNGMPLEGRNEVIFMTFIVILLTLLIPGFTLSPLIRWLKIHPQAENHLLLQVRKELTQVADEAIRRWHASKLIDDDEFEFLRGYVHLEQKAWAAAAQKTMEKLESARSKVVKEKRKKLFALWEQLEIDDRLLSQLEHELDLEETHIARARL